MQIEFDASEVVEGSKQVTKAFDAMVTSASKLQKGVVGEFSKMKEAIKGFRGPTPTTISSFDEFAKVMKKYDKIDFNFSKLARDLSTLGSIKGPNAVTLRNIEKLFQILSTAKPNSGLAQTTTFLRSLTAAATSVAPAVNGVVAAINNHGKAAATAAVPVQTLNNHINGTSTALKGGTPHFQSYGNGLVSLQRFALGTTVALQGLAGVLAFREIYQANVALDKIQAALLAVSSGGEQAKDNFTFVRNEAVRLGIDLETAAKGYTQLLAASKDTSLTTSDIKKLFSQTSEAVRVLGLSTTDAEGVFKAFTQIISKGKLQAEELRGQLGDRIPGAFQLMAKAMGVSTQKLDEMMKKGEIAGDVLFNALKKFGDQLQLLASGGLDKAIDSMQAAVGRLTIAIMESFREIGLGGFNDAVSSVANKLSSLLQQSGVKDFFRDIGSAAKFAADNIGLITGALAGISISGTLFIMVSLFSRMINPLLAVVSGVGLLAGALGGYYLQSAAEAALKTDKLNEALASSKTIMEGLAANNLDKVAEGYGKIANSITRIGDALIDLNKKPIPPVISGMNSVDPSGTFTGNTGPDPAIENSERTAKLKEYRAEVDRLTEAFNAQFLAIEALAGAGVSGLGGLNSEYKQLEALQIKLQKETKDYTDKNAQLQSVTDQLANAEFRRADVQSRLTEVVAQLRDGTDRSVAATRTLRNEQSSLRQEFFSLSAEILKLTKTKESLLDWLGENVTKFGGFASILSVVLGKMAQINQFRFNQALEAPEYGPADPKDANLDAYGRPKGSLSESIKGVFTQIEDFNPSKKTQKQKEIDSTNKFYDDQLASLKKYSAGVEELNTLEESRKKKLQEIAEKYDTAGKSATRSFTETYNRTLDNIRAIIDLEKNGDETFSSISKSSKAYNETQKEGLTGIKNLELAFKALQASGKKFDSVAESINKLDTAREISVISKLGDAHVDLVKEIERTNTALANNELKGKDAADALKYVELQTKKAEKSSELYSTALQALERDMAKLRNEAKEQLDDATLHNDQLRAEISGSDDLSLKIATVTSARAREKTELEGRLKIAPLWEQFNKNEELILQKTAEATTAKSEAVRKALNDEITALREYNLKLSGTASELTDFYKKLADERAATPFLERNAKLAQEARDAWSKPFEEAGKNIFNAFTTLFENIFDNGVKSFKDFGKEILNVFKKLAANIAALLVFQPIVGNVLGGLGFSNDFIRKLGISSGGGSLNGVFTEGSTGQNVFDSVGNIYSAGKSVVSSLWGNGLSNTGVSWIDNTLNTTLFGTTPSEFASSGTAIGEISGLGGSSPSMGGGVTVGGAIGGGIASVGSIINAINNPNWASIGGAAVTTASTVLPMIFSSLSALGPWGMAAGAVLSLIGSFIKKKPSNKGAEYAFNLDDQFSTAYEGTKHPDQMTYVKDFAVNQMQEVIKGLETTYGLKRNADYVGGVNYGIKEGSSFYLGKASDGIEGRQQFKFDPEDEDSIKKAFEEFSVAFLKSGDWEELGKKVGVDITTALKNSTAEDLEGLTEDIKFLTTFNDTLKVMMGGLDPLNSQMTQIAESATTAATNFDTFITTFRDKTAQMFGEVSPEVDKANVALANYALGVTGLRNKFVAVADSTTELGYRFDKVSNSAEGATRPMSALEYALEENKQKFAALEDSLRELGFTTEMIAQAIEDSAWQIQNSAQMLAQATRYSINSQLINNYVPSASEFWGSVGYDPAHVPNFSAYINTLISKAASGTLTDSDRIEAANRINNQATYSTQDPSYFMSGDQINTVISLVNSLFSTSGSIASLLSDAVSNGVEDGIDNSNTDLGNGGTSTDSSSGSSSTPDDSALRTQQNLLSEQISRLNEEISVTKDLIDSFDNLSKSLKDFVDNLNTSDHSPLSIAEQYYFARGQYSTALAKAQAGDQTAMGELPELANKFLDLSDQMFASSENNVRDFNWIKDSMSTVSVKANDLATQQRDLLEQQNAHLVTLEDSLTAIEQAIKNLNSSSNNNGNGGSTGTPSTPSTPSTPTTPSQPTGLAKGKYIDPTTGKITDIKFGIQNLGRGDNQNITSFMTERFPNYTGPMTEDSAYNWILSSHGSGLAMANGGTVSNQIYYAAAYQAGYHGAFGSGLHTKFLNEDPNYPSEWAQFIKALRSFGVVVPDDYFIGRDGMPIDMSKIYKQVPGYAYGGLVLGGAGGYDSTMIAATPGERVLSGEQSRIIEKIAMMAEQDYSEIVEALQANHEVLCDTRAYLAKIAENSQNDAAKTKVAGGVK